jgi:hypothetical protein
LLLIQKKGITMNLESTLQKAYTLAVQVMEGRVDTVLAEEVSGECAELLEAEIPADHEEGCPAIDGFGCSCGEK